MILKFWHIEGNSMQDNSLWVGGPYDLCGILIQHRCAFCNYILTGGGSEIEEKKLQC